jgi:Zn finger protein HypA/HybF involved in hydrogenase expression
MSEPRRLNKVNDPCPYCGRAMWRSTLARLEEPFCPACITERIKASGGKPVDVDSIRVDEWGYVTFEVAE